MTLHCNFFLSDVVLLFPRGEKLWAFSLGAAPEREMHLGQVAFGPNDSGGHLQGKPLRKSAYPACAFRFSTAIPFRYIKTAGFGPQISVYFRSVDKFYYRNFK